MKLVPVQTTPPATRLVSLAVAKAHLRVDHADENDLITALALAAEQYLDGYRGVLGRPLITQTWAESFPRFSYRLPLRVPGVQSITSVTYYDNDEAEQTVSSGIYRLHEAAQGAYLVERDNQSWPSTYTRDDAVTVTYVAGYGDAVTNVPQPIIQAALLLIGHWYENRQAVGSVGDKVALAFDALTAPYLSRAGR